MHAVPGLTGAAHLFKVLGNESRLWLLRLVADRPTTVGALADASGMSQPLVSQHLRTLREAGLVLADRSGREVSYRIADHHVTYVIDDAMTHALEPAERREPHTPR